MDDKIFDLLEKLYIEVQEMKQVMATKDDIKDMATKADIAEVKQSIVRLEDKVDTNHKALYDGYKLTYEKLTTLEDKVDKLDKKVEQQDVEIRVIKEAK